MERSMTDSSNRYPVIEKLSADLGFEYREHDEIDWAMTNYDGSRLDEFVEYYCARRASTSVDDAYLFESEMVELIIWSAAEVLGDQGCLDQAVAERIKSIWREVRGNPSTSLTRSILFSAGDEATAEEAGGLQLGLKRLLDLLRPRIGGDS
jgi:hypothetical protein